MRRAGPCRPATRSPTRAIAEGEPVRRYNQIIGFATQPTSRAGEHVHVAQPGDARLRARLRVRRDVRADASSCEPRAPSRASCAPTAAWRRATTSASSPRVNCSATVAQVRRRALHGRPRSTHIPTSTASWRSRTKPVAAWRSTGEGMRHPAPDHRGLCAPSRISPPCCIVGLGCEANQMEPRSSAPQGSSAATSSRTYDHPGQRRHREGGARRHRDASRRCCRRRTRSSARPCRRAT